MSQKKRYVGVDLHKSQFTTCVREEGKKNRYEQYPATEEGYQKFLKEVRTFEEQGGEVAAAVESTGNTRYFKRRLTGAGVEVHVINPQRFKAVSQSVHKTDKYDAAAIAEFLEADMLPEAKLCSEQSERQRRLLKGRTLAVQMAAAVKNQVHGLLTGLGMSDTKASLQSRKGRRRVLDALKGTDCELAVQPFMATIEAMGELVKGYEAELKRLTEKDPVIELLRTIPGCGPITAWTIRAFTDGIKRFESGKKYAACAGLVPWVKSSNQTVHMGRITKRGPQELRTALVQLVMGILRMKKKTLSWRLMIRYEQQKRYKGSGKSIISMARKLAVIVWRMLSEGKEFDVSLMTDKKLERKAARMREAAFQGGAAAALQAFSAPPDREITGVAG